LPSVLSEDGFAFDYPHLTGALAALCETETK